MSPHTEEKFWIQCLHFLKEKGAKIIQYDTDGVIYSHDTISIDQLHNELTSFMPDWINIDLEARYDWTWIYKAKKLYHL